MQYLELTFQQTEWNLALDEALLWAAETGRQGEILRLWENPTTAVVVGRASEVHREVDVDTCAILGVPIVRRCSGGCAVVIGPGCLMYTLVLDLERQPGWRRVDQLHRVVLGKLGVALSDGRLVVAPAGLSDLAVVSPEQATTGTESGKVTLRKFSGNSVRYGRRYVLYHGTLLYAFEIEMISRLLRMPPRQPEYRTGRPHGEFLTNLPIDRSQLIARLKAAWNANSQRDQWPEDIVEELMKKRYLRHEWHWER